MSVDKEKKFVMKHTFTGVKNMKNNERHYGNQAIHFNIPWSIYIFPCKSSSMALLRLECHKPCEESDWSIDMTVNTKVLTPTTGVNFSEIHQHTIGKGLGLISNLTNTDIPLAHHLVDGNLTVECHVTINKVTGFEIPMERFEIPMERFEIAMEKHIFRSFNDESAKEISDVALVVKNQKFYVLKMYLVGHSPYFKSLFLGNFDETKQSEVELKDIEPEDFQKFLEVLYGDPDINDDNIEGILQLGDMYDAKAAIRQCEDFLLHKSKKNSKLMFVLSVKYNMYQLQKKCILELKNAEDIEKCVHENGAHVTEGLWRHLLERSIALLKEK